MKCEVIKPIAGFYRQADMRGGHRNNCKECHAITHRDWYDRNREYEKARVKRWQQENSERVNAGRRELRAKDPERHKYRDREGHLWRKYRLNTNMFEALVSAQLGNCAICGANEDLNLHVDHDHRTNRVRGLLCGKCNKAIGLLNDDPELLISAERYLERANRFWSRSA